MTSPTGIPPLDQIRQRIDLCRAELVALRRLLRLSKALAAADAARDSRQHPATALATLDDCRAQPPGAPPIVGHPSPHCALSANRPEKAADSKARLSPGNHQITNSNPLDSLEKFQRE